MKINIQSAKEWFSPPLRRLSGPDSTFHWPSRPRGARSLPGRRRIGQARARAGHNGDGAARACWTLAASRDPVNVAAMTLHLDRAAVRARLHRHGFAFVTADNMRHLLSVQDMADWAPFKASWDDLAPDTYLAALGRQRRRRHATFTIECDGSLRREPHQPHWQSALYNPLQGDIQRWFLPMRPTLAGGASMEHVLRFAHALFAPMKPGGARRWHVEAHQFRIEAREDEPGEPTPEGVHRDGVDYVLVLLIDRINIERGTTTIHGIDGSLLGSFVLARPLDAALVDDARVLHGVTPVIPIDPSRPSHRDVLVVTLQAIAPRGENDPPAGPGAIRDA